MSETPKVYAAIAAVTEEMAREGIAKGRKNQQQGYQFRGIDDVYNALSPVLARNKLCILPNVLERGCEERQTAKGGALFYVTVRVRFDFVSAEDGSRHEVHTYGEAMDSADKATNKAMSAAYKYAAMQAFCIPTEGDNDADAHTHEVVGRAAADGQQYRDILNAIKAEIDGIALQKLVNEGVKWARFMAKNPQFEAGIMAEAKARKAELQQAA
jgi:hypothetical protein